MNYNLSLKNYRSAFTMIEMSITILIVSVMIIGVVSMQLMIKKARLANAKSLTQNSIVNDMDEDLVMWLESSLESSFLENERKNDNINITIWKDNNKNLLNKNDATAIATVANQPKYFSNLFYNSIPGIRFSGGQWLNFNGNKLVKSPYTIFIVEQRRSNSGANYWIGGTSSSTNQNLIIGYRSDNTITIAHYANDNDYASAVPNFNNQITARIHTIKYNNQNGKSYNLNGVSKTASSTGNNTSIQSFLGASIGSYPPGSAYYNGDIAEIIIFKKSLRTEEVKAIENYLGSKYGITVS